MGERKKKEERRKKKERRIFLLRVENGTMDVTCKLVWVPGYALNLPSKERQV